MIHQILERGGYFLFLLDGCFPNRTQTRSDNHERFPFVATGTGHSQVTLALNIAITQYMSKSQSSLLIICFANDYPTIPIGRDSKIYHVMRWLCHTWPWTPFRATPLCAWVFHSYETHDDSMRYPHNYPSNHMGLWSSCRTINTRLWSNLETRSTTRHRIFKFDHRCSRSAPSTSVRACSLGLYNQGMVR